MLFVVKLSPIFVENLIFIYLLWILHFSYVAGPYVVMQI